MLFQRLIDEDKLMVYRHDGRWARMNTSKETQDPENMFGRRKLGLGPVESSALAKGRRT